MNDNLFQVTKDGKSGFINDKGQIVIDLTFDGVSSFSEGLARIFVDDKVGFIDKQGNIQVEPKFDTVSGFSEGMAYATIGDKYGYIDKSGNFIIEPMFYRCWAFENGYALVMQEVVSTGCFIDNFGTIKLNGRNFLVSKYSEGLINCSERGDWGHIDINGNFIIPPNYKYTREFSEGKAAIAPKKINGKANRKDLYAFINKGNEIIIPPLFTGADIHFSEGMCAVFDSGYGYINAKGQLIIPCDLCLGQHFSEGLAVIKEDAKIKKYGYIDKTGTIAIKPTFTLAESFKNGLASVTIGKKYEEFKHGYIDKSGNYIWEPTR
ncbi:hypothetical protein A5893_09885 [Pedobacter psychrophilus]|uniref:WG repeat-containing protein n=1 Tax=Pedobacter psychrophilus TaxID=1826909 RepID=A0A179DH89_9SPHI|nr:WG repeat-containing protein [Pedobacter psychrophilus]OAQ39869.1 hypothetical protein A5893_09885 [Pedobacter psychrophilus]